MSVRESRDASFHIAAQHRTRDARGTRLAAARAVDGQLASCGLQADTDRRLAIYRAHIGDVHSMSKRTSRLARTVSPSQDTHLRPTPRTGPINEMGDRAASWHPPFFSCWAFLLRAWCPALCSPSASYPCRPAAATQQASVNSRHRPEYARLRIDPASAPRSGTPHSSLLAHTVQPGSEKVWAWLAIPGLGFLGRAPLNRRPALQGLGD